MSWVEVTEIVRNIGLTVLAGAGAYLAFAQLRRSRSKDQAEIFVRAMDLCGSEDPVARRGGRDLLATLVGQGEYRTLAERALRSYDESGGDRG